MESNEKKKQIFFSLGVLSFLIGLVCIPTRFNMFIFCIIISFLCFYYSREKFKKIFLNPIIRNIIKEKKKKRIIEDEINSLKQKKQEIIKFLKNKEQYVLNIDEYNQLLKSLSLKEKRLNKNIIILEEKEKKLRNKIDEEQPISKLIETKEEKIKDLNNHIDNLIIKKSNLQKEEKQLEEKEKFKNNATLEYIDNLDGVEFEKFIMLLLRYLEFKESYTTKETGDYGIDVIAVKNNIKFAIQCKNYIGPVGNKAIQEAYSGKDYYDCHVAIVATNNYFTKNAIKQANKNKVVLWDRDIILKMIKSIK